MAQQKKYDVFISYRRSDTGQRAEHLKDLLEHDYVGRISFDRENLTGLFDVELARRIDNCKDFVLLVGEKTFVFTDKNFSPEEVHLYKYLSSAPLDEFQKKIAQLGTTYPLDFVRIEIGRALNNSEINIIPIVPESSDIFNFSKLQLPDDIENIKRYEAVFYSSHKDALFKNVVPILKRYLKSYTSRAKRILSSLIAIVTVILLIVGGVFWRNKPIVSKPIQPVGSYQQYQDSVNRTNKVEIERLRQDSIARALQAEADRLAQERTRLEQQARETEEQRKAAAAKPKATTTTMAPKVEPTPKVDPLEAKKAKADAGDAISCYQVAQAYQSGDGVQKDLAIAFKYMKSAAEKGYKPAYIEVAKMYHGGRGVAKNRSTAEFWYKKAADAGNAEARRILLNM